MVNALCAAGAEVNAVDNDGNTALILAARKGHIEVVKALLDNRTDVDTGNEACNTALVGAVNLPIIKYSVDWWSTLHQPASVSVFEKASIHHTMLIPLALMTAAFALFSLLIFLMKYNTELIKIKNKGLDRL